MIVIERKRMIAARAEQVRAVLSDLDQLDQLLPRVERAEVLAQGESRARMAITLRLGRLGTQRVEGEARVLDDGLRFVAVDPFEIDARWTVLPRESQSEVVARVAVDLPRKLAAMIRLLPQRMIGERVGGELESALARLESLAQGRDTTGDRHAAAPADSAPF
jgi:carbon monoxide dehydrogenase subunit G